MKKHILTIAITALALSFFSSQSFASGFRLPETSASAMGMASAFVGQADDPSATWYNPAGTTQLEGTQISGGFVAIYPVLTHENNTVNPGTTDVSKRDLFYPIHLYGTHKLNDKITLSLGITNPFGLTTDWDETASTRYVATLSDILTVNFNPNLAYKVSDDLSLAAGISYIYLDATLENISWLGPGVGDHNFRLNGDGDGWGVNVAALYKASDKVNLGLSYRSRMKVDVDGNAEFTGLIVNNSQSASTSVTLPDMIQLGISYKVTNRLILNGDLEYNWWSTYDRLVIESTLLPGGSVTQEKQWDDQFIIRLGGQYTLSDKWKLRAGYLFDENPVPEEHFETRVPDSDRHGFSIGTGFTANNLTIDASYMYLLFTERTITDSLEDDVSKTPLAVDALNGKYKTEAHLLGLTVGYKF